MEDRGILPLAPQEWSEGMYDYTSRLYLDRVETEGAFYLQPDMESKTVHIMRWLSPMYERADISIGDLLLEVLREGGTTAQAIQSMNMGILASAYQDLFIVEADNKTTPQREEFMPVSMTRDWARRSDFVAVQVPGGSGGPATSCAGATPPYVLVITAVLLHCIVVGIIIIWYMKGMFPTNNISRILTVLSNHGNTSRGVLVECGPDLLDDDCRLSRAVCLSARHRCKSLDAERWRAFDPYNDCALS